MGVRNPVFGILLSLTFLGLSACTSTPVELTYDAGAVTAQPNDQVATVEIVSVSDHRKHDPHWLGAIRGGFGNPLKTLTTAKPVSMVVKDAFEAGLDARGLLAAGGSDYVMRIDVNQFDCNQFARREAHILLYVTLADAQTGQMVYAEDIKIDKVTGSAVTLDAGVFASVDDLRVVANDVLQQAVDRVLDDPAVSAALIRA